MNEKEKKFKLQGERKVKVEENFASKIKLFWNNIIDKLVK